MKLSLIRKNVVMWALICYVIVANMSQIYAMNSTKTLLQPTHSTSVKIIETPHLILRPFNVEDTHYIFEHWETDSEIVSQLDWTHLDGTSYMEVWLKNSSNFRWCITIKGGDEPIGVIGIQSIIDPHTCELNFAVSKAYQNRGIMTEALSYVRWYLLAEAHFTTNTDFTKLVVYIDKADSAAIHVLLKNSFERLGSFDTKDNPDRIMYQTVPSYQEFLNIEF